MGRFCGYCGCELSDNASFCPVCGAKTAAKKDNSLFKILLRKKFWIIFAGGAAAAVAVILIIVTAVRPAYMKKIQIYTEAVNGRKSAVGKIAPEEYWEYVAKNNRSTVEDAMDQAAEYLAEQKRTLEDFYGGEIFISCEVMGEDECSEQQLSRFQTLLKNVYDIPKQSVTEAYELEMNITIKGGDKKKTEEVFLWVVKIDKEWYLFNGYNFMTEFVTPYVFMQ